MGLLSFRRKSKKNDSTKSKHNIPDLVLERSDLDSESDSNDSPASTYSPIADSFMAVSPIPEITAYNLLHEILSELPVSNKAEQSTTTDENLKPPRDNIPSLDSMTNFSDKSNKLDSNYRFSKIQYLTHSSKNVSSNASKNVMKRSIITNDTPKIERDYRRKNVDSIYNSSKIIDVSTSGYSKSDSSSSTSSLSSTEELIPLHPVSRSYPRNNNLSVISNNDDQAPLIDLISHSCSSNSANTYIGSRNMSSYQPSPALNNAQSTIQRSPGFAIDRMKERHRQECRRSLQWTPLMRETAITHPVRRAISLATSDSKSRNTTSYFQQRNYLLQQQQNAPTHNSSLSSQQHQRDIGTPTIYNAFSSSLIKGMLPSKSHSTTVSSPYRGAWSQNAAYDSQSRQRNMMTIQEVFQEQEALSSPCYKRTDTTQPLYQDCINQETRFRKKKSDPSVTKNSVSDTNNNTAGFGTTHIQSHKGYTNAICHAKQVTQLHHTCSIVSTQKRVSDSSELANQDTEIETVVNNFKTLSSNEEKILEKVDVALKNHSGTNSTSQVGSRYTQALRTRSFSAPSITQLLDNSENKINEIQSGKSVDKANTLTRQVAFVCTSSNLKEESDDTNKIDNGRMHHPKKVHCCHKLDDGTKYRHCSSTSVYKRDRSTCCRHARYVNPACCNVHHSHFCNLPLQQVDDNPKTPSQKSVISFTSPSAVKQPHVVRYVKNNKLEISGKNLHNSKLHRPICRTCRH